MGAAEVTLIRENQHHIKIEGGTATIPETRAQARINASVGARSLPVNSYLMSYIRQKSNDGIVLDAKGVLW
jgi:hypothetical protein